ncbi:hypothetical protein GGI20_002892, partial [Coemansia sp. BCRC 34301]
MSLRPIYYNCYKGWEYVALAIIAGICNIVVCPAFVIMAWTYKDGYGIRRSLSIGSASGLLLWVVKEEVITADGDIYDSYGHLVSQSAAYTIVFATLFGVYIAYILVTFSAFVYRALYQRDKSLLERSVFLLSVCTFTGTIFVTSIMAHGFLANYPCYVDIWLLSFGYIMWATTIVLYMARYYVIVRFHKNIDTETRVNPVTPDNLVEYMMRLRLATHQVFWQNMPNLGEPARESHLPIAAQSSGVPFSLIGRVLSRRRQETATGAVLTESKAHLDNHRQPSSGPTLESVADGVAQDISRQGSDQADNFASSGNLARQTVRTASITRRKKELKDKWTRRFQSDRFAASVLLVMLLVVVGYLALLSSLFTHLKLSRVYYNCFSGPGYIPQMVVTGVFNVIINPAYTIIVWSYRDAYGIRNLMIASCAMGVIFWAGAMTWRLNSQWGNLHLSASIVYITQMVFVYTCYVVIPLINSIRFSRARRQILSRSTHLVEQGSVVANPDDLFQAADDSLRREFLDDMQSADKHEEVKSFAASCFCAELVSFLDVFQAFKNCVYKDMLAKISTQQLSVQLGSSANVEAISELDSISTTMSTQNSNSSVPNWGVQSLYDEITTRSSESRAAASVRTSLVLGHKNLAHAIFNRDNFGSGRRAKRKKHIRSSRRAT